ncbi:hypothetical protein [Cupriavidus sp. WS]|uniref:hypothetical protein n=1 Tax=Cupriavidus sp. WS TaxID=1312922 RepID=UPI0005BBE288|nr:hypothetical protein [Cupriavidus sp. WS]
MPINNNAMNGVRLPTIRTINPAVFAPPLAAAGYPFLLMLFHALVGPSGSQPGGASIALATLVLICAFSAPVLGIIVACQPQIQTSMRRLAYASVVAPTLYVFLGVVQALIGSPIPDPWIWCVIWLGAVLWAFRMAGYENYSETRPDMGRWRVAHGISAVILCIYVLFHLGNHLVGLIGPSAHGAVMDVGRVIYRATFIEPVLIIIFLFQIASGLYLTWRWSSARHEFFRTFQIASGVYLSVFILGHMNSVFIYARTYLGIPTDWNFAIGAPTGLIHDPWNIRLLPHYALGVFFVLSHLVAGLRVILNAHGADKNIANRVWVIGVAASAAIAAAIIAGMCGVRV